MCTYRFNTPLYFTHLVPLALLSNGQQLSMDRDPERRRRIWLRAKKWRTLYSIDRSLPGSWKGLANGRQRISSSAAAATSSILILPYGQYLHWLCSREGEGGGQNNNNINNDRSSFRGRKILIELFEIQFWTHTEEDIPRNSSCNWLLPYPVLVK